MFGRLAVFGKGQDMETWMCKFFDQHCKRRGSTKFCEARENLVSLKKFIFRVDFFKFHDFSRFLELFPNSVIFPGLENFFFSFSRFP